jgi:hypothetical protein
MPRVCVQNGIPRGIKRDSKLYSESAMRRRCDLKEIKSGYFNNISGSRSATDTPRDVSKNSDKYICRRALNTVLVKWDSDPSLAASIKIAKEKGFTPQSCAKLLGRSDVVETPTDNSTNSIEERLEGLKSLLEKGLITKDEAAEKRKAILEGL